MTTSDPVALVVEAHAGVETWTMNLGPVNPIGPLLIGALTRALDDVESSDETSVVLLRSSSHVFSAGGDAAWMASLIEEGGPDGLLREFENVMAGFREVCRRLHEADVLSIAVIEGHALAGGLELAAACDLRIAVDDPVIQIGVPEMSLFGVLPSGGGGTHFLARILGRSRALLTVVGAKPMTPAEASSIGLVDQLHSREEIDAEVQGLARGIAATAGRGGIRAAKSAMALVAPLKPDQFAEDSRRHWAWMWSGPFRERVSAFVDKFGQRGKA